MKKLTYEQIRKIIIDKCVIKKACGSENKPHDKEFGKLISAKTEAEFWEVIKQNANWSFEHKIISIELFENYDHKKLNDCQIFVSGINKMESGLAIMLGGTLSDMWGGTLSDMWGGTLSNMRGGTLSNMRGGTLSNMWGGTLSDMWGGTLSDMWGGTLSDMRGGTLSNMRGGTLSNMWGGTLSDKIKKISGNSTIRCLLTKRIYIKKGEFEIIYLD